MRHIMKCRSVEKKLSAYQDRELKPGDQEELKVAALRGRAPFENVC